MQVVSYDIPLSENWRTLLIEDGHGYLLSATQALSHYWRPPDWVELSFAEAVGEPLPAQTVVIELPLEPVPDVQLWQKPEGPIEF